ncbi:putative Ubiquinone biosynthesis monooxygenase UbiB [Magnetofaba australis IT-1]|uniref:Putative Ubiquinone biosynthesis monooxygenase UbiB n=1 Tax=Magnetofaba australis IT-1 TaxID=1434232 RepID=A0A1Y2K0E3_9PROT|nr:putative Ubiquinone biosynthesis monooxygenase UbiB [Magnetofaba australis IT-1]
MGRELYPPLNAWEIAKPLVKEWMQEELGPKGRMRQFRKALEESGQALASAPELALGALDRLANDRLWLRVHQSSFESVQQEIRQGFARQSAATMGGTLFLGGAILAAADFSAWWYAPPFIFATVSLLRGMVTLR